MHLWFLFFVYTNLEPNSFYFILNYFENEGVVVWERSWFFSGETLALRKEESVLLWAEKINVCSKAEEK